MGTPFLDGLRSPDQLLGDYLLEQAQKFGLDQTTMGALQGVLQGSARTPNTRVRLTHALYIKAGRRTIGGVHLFELSLRRTVEREWEIDANGVGLCALITPGAEECQIRMSRYDMYLDLMESALGTRELAMLTDQRVGLTFREVWRGPSGLFGGGVRAWDYVDAWYTDLGRPLDAKGDRVSNANATFEFRQKVPRQ